MRALLRFSFRPMGTRSNEKMVALTDYMEESSSTPKVYGRAWAVDDLRIKSNQDLHKLWYVLLKEKNKINSDNILKRKFIGEIGPQGRMTKIRCSMARLLTVVNERKKICREYRTFLEEQYVATKREEFDSIVKANTPEKEVYVPEVSTNLLRAKFKDMRLGIDNLDYIKRAVSSYEKKKGLKAYLDEKYDYKNKKVVPADAQIPPEEEDQVIRKFTSTLDSLLAEGKHLPTDEILRMHVRNWRMLSLKQRRIILNKIQARRARETKSEFIKELRMMGQKMKLDSQNKKTESE